MTVAILSLVPGLGHLLHARAGRALLFGVSWLTFGVLFVASPSRVFAALQGASLDGKIAAVFLLSVLAGLPLLSVLDCRRLRRRRERKGRERNDGSGDGRAAALWGRFARNRPALIGVGLVLAVYCVALLAPLLAPYDPNAQHDIVGTRYLSPRSAHLLGTDKYGRDILSRIIYGSRISLSIGFVAVGIAVTLGTLLGAVSGAFGGRVDWGIMRLVDVMIAFPRIFIVLTLIALYSPRIWLIIAVLGATSWMGVARLVRGQVLALKEQEFVQATRALGIPRSRVIFRHLLPNTLSPIIVAATLMIGDVILTEAVLSFLGLGVQPPTASWGSIINQGRENLLGAWWVATFPGLAIVLTVVSYNLVGDGLRDALDPRLND
jgi:peptide/nickel transport system permease protein